MAAVMFVVNQAILFDGEVHKVIAEKIQLLVRLLLEERALAKKLAILYFFNFFYVLKDGVIIICHES